MSQTVRLPRVVFTFTRGANARLSTRATLVSTSAARRSYAKDATAPAVYAPMPGSCRSAGYLPDGSDDTPHSRSFPDQPGSVDRLGTRRSIPRGRGPAAPLS